MTFCQATFRSTPGLATVPLAGTPLWYRHVLIWPREGPFAEHGGLVAGIAAEAYEQAIRRNSAYPAWLARHAEDPSAPVRER